VLLAAGEFFLDRDQVIPLAIDPGQATLEQSEAPVVRLVPHQGPGQIAQLLQPLGGFSDRGRRTEIQLGMERAAQLVDPLALALLGLLEPRLEILDLSVVAAVDEVPRIPDASSCRRTSSWSARCR
jgi:hypothetical protein